LWYGKENNRILGEECHCKPKIGKICNRELTHERLPIINMLHINIKEQFLGIYAPTKDDSALTQDEFYEKLTGR
jgi:hypothetical protein